MAERQILFIVIDDDNYHHSFSIIYKIVIYCSQHHHKMLIIFPQVQGDECSLFIERLFMRLKPEEEERLNRILAPIRNDERVQRMKNYIQHGSISTYQHVENVTRLSYWLNCRLHLGADERVLSIGAFLHDYYLYDWHKKSDSNKMHGFTHAKIACENAKKHFNIGKRTQEVIEKHMWPLNISKIPVSREAWIVCLADKWISTKETLFCRAKVRAVAEQV